MSLAETAVLAVELKLNGAQSFKSGIAEADAASASLGRTAAATGNVMGGTASKMSLVKQAAVSTGEAISGMASHFKNVITGPLGLIGLGAGLFTVAGAIHAGIDEAQAFGLEVQKLQGLTEQSVENVSALAAALDHFGVSGDAAVKTVGMLTKNIGNIVNSKGGLAGFAQTFGLTLTDAKGHLVDINEEILRTADYFNNKSIPATEKAAALAKLYGRSWQQLIPFLQAGRQGITEAEQAAKDLGLTLTAQNLGDLKRYRENFLTLGDAVKGLELQIGLVLMPTLSDLAKSVTGWLAHGGRETLVTFFKNALDVAKQFGSFVSGTVIPTISGLASTAKGFWDAIPAPLRDLLLKGFIADRTIHFLFGVSPIHLATSLLGDIAGPVVKTLIANRLIPQPVVIVGGGVPGLPGGNLIPEAAGAAGGLSAATVASVAALAAVPLIPLVAAYFLAGGAEGIATRDLAGRQATAAARGLNPANVPISGGRGTTNVFGGWQAAQAAAKNLGGDIEQLRGLIAPGLDGLGPKTKKQAAHILGVGTAHDRDTSAAIADLHKTAKTNDIEALRGAIATKLAAAERATKAAGDKTAAAARAAGSLTAGAIKDKDLLVTIPVSTYVNGRLLTSQIGRYSTTQQLRNLAGNLR